MWGATVILPLKIPRWWYGIKQQRKPCVNCTEMSLQWGASRIMMSPKMWRRTFSKFLSNRSFPYFRLTPKALPAYWNVATFDSSLLICSERSGVASVVGISPLLLPRTARNAPCTPGCLQIALHGTNHHWIAQMATSSCRRGTKVKSVMFSGEVANPQRKYDTIIPGSTSLHEDGACRSLSRATCDAGESQSWLRLSMNNVGLLRKNNIPALTTYVQDRTQLLFN